jgi:apolipoprotein N-acyltransferase
MRVFCGILSGLLLVLSLPKPDLYPLAWIALAPWLWAIAIETNPRKVLLSSYVAGCVFFAGTFYWITETMMIYGGLAVPLAVGVGLLFAFAYALYFVIFGLALHFAIQQFGTSGVFLAAPIWVAVELLRAHLFSGFPWMLFGYALVPYSGILQIVTWTGIYGLSFIAAAVNSIIVYGIVTRRKLCWTAAVACMGLAWAFPVIGERPSNGDAIRVRLVQTNIDLDQPWQDQAAADQLLTELAALSSREQGKPKLIVWPETPAPFYLNEDAAFRNRIGQIAAKLKAYVLIGYIDAMGEGPSNSAAVVDPHGEIISRYDKMHLVPFGEYIPFKRLLFFADSLTRQVGDFSSGTEYTVTSLEGHRISTAICYESIFPDLVRQFVQRGSELLVVITNDGWFGESSAPYQHLRMGVVRAVENRRYMVRTANTGISAVISPYGRIESSTPIGVRMILDGTAHFRSDRTFYTQHGDVFAYANALTAAIGVLAVYDRRRISKRGLKNARRTD